MKREEMSLEDVIDLMKRAFPDLDSDSVDEALKEIDYMKMFPEDIVEERTSWDELYSTVCSLRRGFNALYDVVLRMAEDKVCEDHEDSPSYYEHRRRVK